MASGVERPYQSLQPLLGLGQLAPLLAALCPACRDLAGCLSTSMQKAIEDPRAPVGLNDQVDRGCLTWAYRWSLVCMANSGLTALPNRNLAKYWLWGRGGYCWARCVGWLEGLATEHPLLACRVQADAYSFNGHFGIAVAQPSIACTSSII